MGEWQNGICGCFNNCGICIITYFVPCYTVGKNAEALGDNCCCYCILALIPVVNLIVRVSQRGKIRERQGIDGGIISDILCAWCLPLCSLVQEAQEVEHMKGGGMALEEIERM